MNINSRSVRFISFIVGLIGLFSFNISAQNKVSATAGESTKTCAGKFVMPASIEVASDVFEDYLRVASLSADKRGSAFSELSNEKKAFFIKVNWALQLVKRPNMTKAQQEFVLDAISKVSADIYDKTDYEKTRSSEQTATEMINIAFGLFGRRDAGDFVEPMQMPKDREVALVKRYEALLKYGMKKRMEIAKEMPVADRVNIWKTQVAYHLAAGRFSKAQNEFILGELMSLSPETFAPRAGLTKEEESAFAAKSLSRIFNVFTKEEGYAIFMAVGIQKYVKDAPVDTNNLESPSCQCLVYCAGERIVCGSENGCVSTPDGCGPWGTLGCHYQCVLVIID
jgi:hypothetical protein